jgi:hypothetical protein
VDKEEEPRKIKTHEDLGIYQKAFNAAMTREQGRGFGQLYFSLLVSVFFPFTYLLLIYLMAKAFV